MVPSELVVAGIKDVILKGDKSQFILVDGFPRNE